MQPEPEPGTAGRDDAGEADQADEAGAPDGPPGDLLRDTTPVPDDRVAGRFHVTIPTAWQVVHAFGGVTMATALRAITAAVARDELDLVVAHATFCAPVPCGPVVVDVEVLRDGRTAAQATADLRVAGHDQIALRVQAVLGVDHGGEDRVREVRMPEVPPPAACDPPPPAPDDSPFGRINFHHQSDWRPVTDNPPWALDFAPGPARFRAWSRLHRPPRHADGRYETAALAVPADAIGPAVSQALGRRDRPYMVLSLDIGLRVVAPPAGDWILQDMEAWEIGSGYASGPTRLWDERGDLVALATQTAHLREFPAGRAG